MRFEGLDLNLLVALDVLLDTQSVTEASLRLNLSQPSVSAALGRLRDYFDDDLLVQVGRRMMPTAKAENLRPAIKEVLNLIRFRIAQADDYDACRSQRQFRVLASDYAYDVLLSGVLAKAEGLAPDVSFDIAPTGPAGTRAFANGDIDVMITVSSYVFSEHPQQPLFTDSETVICWDKGRHAQGISADEFQAASHAIAAFGEERRPTVSDLHLESAGIKRRIAVRVPSFAALPATIVGTDRVALMHSRHARLFAKLYPIAFHPVPIAMPVISEILQWHRLRGNDPGARWLIDLLVREAAALEPLPRND